MPLYLHADGWGATDDDSEAWGDMETPSASAPKSGMAGSSAAPAVARRAASARAAPDGVPAATGAVKKSGGMKLGAQKLGASKLSSLGME